MSEAKKTNKTAENNDVEVEVVEETTEKQVKKQKKTEEKPGIFKRMGNWCKRNKKPIFACVGSFVGGAGAAYGGSMLLAKHKEKKRQTQNTAYIQQPEQEYSPLDPNV